MLKNFIKMLGFGPSVNYAELVKNGAIILDVRSKSEYSGGHIQGSINIPLDQLSGKLSQLKNKNQAVIICCASGMRSASAKALLQRKGYTQVLNGGGWSSLQQKITNAS